MRLFFTLLSLLPFAGIQSEPYPHVQSKSDYRVINRRHISHILYEKRGEKESITFLTTHPAPWNFHADSHPLYYYCKENCLSEMKKIDSYLRSGHNLGLKLLGSEILAIRYFQ